MRWETFVTSLTHVCHFVLFTGLQRELDVMDEKLTQKNEEMNILLNYKVCKVNRMMLCL